MKTFKTVLLTLAVVTTITSLAFADNRGNGHIGTAGLDDIQAVNRKDLSIAHLPKGTTITLQEDFIIPARSTDSLLSYQSDWKYLNYLGQYMGMYCRINYAKSFENNILVSKGTVWTITAVESDELITRDNFLGIPYGESAYALTIGNLAIIDCQKRDSRRNGAEPLIISEAEFSFLLAKFLKATAKKPVPIMISK
ncbi:MAG: hypothetical protein V4654_06830 [Bdellovibrionota bacterium]